MMRLQRLAIAVSLLLLVAAPSLADAPKTATSGAIAITGDSFDVDNASHVAVFTGNVTVTAPQLKLTADKISAAYGDAGPSSIKSLVATGHVVIVTRQQTAHGDQATYNPKTRVLQLTGNVVVEGASGQIKGGEMDVNLNTNVTSFSGGKPGGRVTGVFTPQ